MELVSIAKAIAIAVGGIGPAFAIGKIEFALALKPLLRSLALLVYEIGVGRHH